MHGEGVCLTAPQAALMCLILSAGMLAGHIKLELLLLENHLAKMIRRIGSN